MLFFAPENSTCSNIFALLRWAYYMGKVYSTWMNKSPLNLGIHDPFENKPTQASLQGDRLTQKFQSLVRLHQIQDQDGIEASYTSLKLLVSFFLSDENHAPKVNRKALCRAWLGKIPPEFLRRVQTRQIDALFVLSHFCIFLSGVDHDGIWYMKGWAASILGECLRTVEKGWQDQYEWSEVALHWRSVDADQDDGRSEKGVMLMETN